MTAPAPRPPTSLRQVLDEAAGLLGEACAPEDDLFERGATSMTAIRLATRLARRCGRPITAADVLVTRTPAGLAARIDALPADGAETAADRRPAAADTVLPDALRPFWAIADGMPNQQEALVPMLLRLSGDVDVPALRAALDAVVARHEALRSMFVADGERVTVHLVPAAELAGLLMVESGGSLPPAEPADAVAAARRWLLSPFGLAGTVPIRARLIPTADGCHLLAIVVHHIAMDGWSHLVFCRDLVRAYRAARTGEPAFTVPAAGYLEVFAEQARLPAAAREEAVRYWSDLVRDAPWLRFPGAERAGLFGPAADLELPLTAEVLAPAGHAAARVGGTATAVLLAAYVRRLRAHLGTADLAVSVPLAGRVVPASEEAVGCFAGGVALRLPAGCTDPVELVSAASRQLAAAIAAPPLTLEQVYPAPPAGFPRHPLVQVYFAPQEPIPARLEFDGMRGESLGAPPTSWYAEIAMEIRPQPAAGGMLRYRTDVLSPAVAGRFVTDWLADVRYLTRQLLDHG